MPDVDQGVGMNGEAREATAGDQVSMVASVVAASVIDEAGNELLPQEAPSDPGNTPAPPGKDLGGREELRAGEGVAEPVTEPAPESIPEPMPEPAPLPAVESRPEAKPTRIQVEFPKDLADLDQVLLYEDEVNGFRPVRMACLDVQDLGGGLVCIIGSVFSSVRIRVIPSGQALEVPKGTIIAVPVLTDLVQIVAEMQKRPEHVLEAWFWSIPEERRELAPGLLLQRYATKGGWLEGPEDGKIMTKAELLKLMGRAA